MVGMKAAGKDNVNNNSDNDRDKAKNHGRERETQQDSRTALDKYRENGYDSGFVFHED